MLLTQMVPFLSIILCIISTMNDEHFGDYGSDLVYEVLEVNTTKSSDNLNISDESSSTLIMLNTSLQGSVSSLRSSARKKHITQV